MCLPCSLQFSSRTLLRAVQFPDPQKIAEDLNAFARMNENRLYKLLKTCLDVQTDLKGLVKASVSAPVPLHRRRLTKQVSQHTHARH